MARKHHFDFQAVIGQALRELGAKQIKHQGYDWQLNTRAGLLRLHPLKTGIDCRFEDRELAHQVVHHGYLDRHAGEWNWYFDGPHADDVESFLRQLTVLMDDLNLMEKMVVRLNARLRASGQTVTVLEPSDGDEFTVTFPPNRLPLPKPRRAAKRNLRAAYLGTDYVFEAEGQPYTLRVGEKNPHVRDLLAKHGVQGAAFVTACNPASLLLGDVHNKLAMRALKRDLGGSGRPEAIYEGAGHGLAGIWPSEPSLMLLGADRLQAEKLGRRYGQYAIVWVDQSGPLRSLNWLTWTGPAVILCGTRHSNGSSSASSGDANGPTSVSARRSGDGFSPGRNSAWRAMLGTKGRNSRCTGILSRASASTSATETMAVPPTTERSRASQ